MSLRRTFAVRKARKRLHGVPDPFLTGVSSALKARTGADAAMISFVTTDRAFIVGNDGLPAGIATEDGVEIEHSFCAHLVEAKSDGLVVEDTRDFPLLDLCPTTSVYGAWVGVPIRFQNVTIGAVSIVAEQPRHWPPTALDAVRQSADAVERELN